MGQLLLAGAASVSITPPLGAPLAGMYFDRRAEGAEDDLQARAIALGDGANEAAIVVLDLVGIAPDLAQTIRLRVESMTGIPAERVMLTCTHTHSGPATSPSPYYEVDRAYVDVLVRRAGDAAALAHQRRREARLLVGHGAEGGVSFNRRRWMKDGTLRTNPSFLDPNIVRPAGPIDPELTLVRIEDTTGRPIALLVSFALHSCLVGGTRFSSDYAGVLSRFFQRLEGPDLVVVFAQGCAGDINHWDFTKPGPQLDQGIAERVGTILAGEAVKIGARLVSVGDGRSVRFARQMLKVPLRAPSAEEVAWATAYSKAEMYEMDDAGLDVVRAHRILELDQLGELTAPAWVQALTVGEFAYLTLPGEVFVELGLALKARSPFTHTVLAELNCTADGYIPSEKAYGEGGYEATSSPFRPGTGELLVETALELLASLREE